MSGWLSRSLLLVFGAAALSTANACAQAEPSPSAVAIDAKDEEKLFGAYSNWRRAVTCATSWAPGPIAGIGEPMATADRALRRLQEAGHASMLARFDAKYEEFDARIEWVCGDGAGVTPPETAEVRLRNLQVAAAQLGSVIDGLVAKP